MWLLPLGAALLPPNGGHESAHSLIMPADEQNAFPVYAPSLVHSHKMPLGVLNLLALSPAERREKRKHNRQLRELEKQKAEGSSNINLISAETFGSRHPALPGDSVDAFAPVSAAPKLLASSRWTQLLAIIDEQRKEGSWAEDRAGPRDAAQHLAAMKLLAVSEPAATHSAFTMTPFQLLHVAAGAAFSAPLAVLGGLATAFRSWSNNNAPAAQAPARAAQQQQESQGVAEAEPIAYWIGSNGPKEMVVAESVAQTTVAHRKPRPRQQQQQQQQERQMNTQLKKAETETATASRQALQVAAESISKSATFTEAVVSNKTREANRAEVDKRVALRKLEAAKAEAAAAKAEKDAAQAAKKAAIDKKKAEASAVKHAEEVEEKKKAEKKAGAAALVAQKVASYRSALEKAEANYLAEDQAEASKAAADKVASLTKAIDEQLKPQTALRRNETVSEAKEAIRSAEKEVAAKAAQEKQAALRLEQIKKIVAQRSKERDSAKRKVALEAAEALSDVQSAEEAARAKMDAAKAVHAAAKAKAGVDAAEALSTAKTAIGIGTPAAKSAAKARSAASLKLFAAATAKREAADKAKLAADARAATATKKQASMRATLVATPTHKATAKADSKADAAKADSKDSKPGSKAAKAHDSAPEHKEAEHANKQKQHVLEHKATSLVAQPASKPTEAAAKGGSEFPAVGRFLGEAKKVNSGRWAQLASLSTKVAALKDLHEKDTSQ